MRTSPFRGAMLRIQLLRAIQCDTDATAIDTTDVVALVVIVRVQDVLPLVK